MTADNHECNNLICANCKQNRDVVHLCFMRPLKEVLPVISYYKYFMILRQLKIRSILKSPHYTYLISSACNSSVRTAKMRKTAETVCDAFKRSTRSG